MIQLRVYQREAIDALYRYFENHIGNPLVVLPTGTGKSVVLAKFIQEAITSFPDTRILMITHVKELIEQNFAALLRVWPDAPAGIHSAGLGSRDIYSQILFCGIQSIHKKAQKIERADLVLVDEAHLINRDANGMYRRFLADLTAINPWLKVIGFTATAYRMDSGMLHNGKDALFDGIAYEAGLGDMVDQGYLSPVTTRKTSVVMDVSDVHKRGGEYIASELEQAVDLDEINTPIVAEIVERGADRGSWLVFCVGKAHATSICGLLQQHVSAACIFGETPAPERDRLIREFKCGKIRALVNVNVLTTGFDAPGVDLIAMLRPTESTGLYVQMIGRGTRLAEGKDNCIVLDFAGNVRRHGPADAVQPKHPGEKEDGVAPVKVCPDCEAIVHASRRVCPHCGHQFPPPEIKLADAPDASAVLTRDITAEWVEVTHVSYGRHEKYGSPPSIRVEYEAGMLNSYCEWVCLEHTGYPRQKAVNWWSRRAPGQPIPKTIDEALSAVSVLPRPTHIQVRKAGKYFDILDARF